MSRPPDQERRAREDALPPETLARFEGTVLPWLDAAYNLARHLLRDPYDAEDAVQDACVRALRHFGGFRGDNPRAWLLTIVRHTCYSWRRREARHPAATEFDEELHGVSERPDDPEPAEERRRAGAEVERALEQLPGEFREVLVLRELEGLSYKEIGEVVRVPVGTVMSRLSRARERMQRALAGGGEGAHGAS
jgi:RNA polymerase sigma-70 factor (ECF subfamily)